MKLLALVIAASAARARRDRLLVEYQRERVTYRVLADACRDDATAALTLLSAVCRVRALRSLVKSPDNREAA